MSSDFENVTNSLNCQVVSFSIKNSTDAALIPTAFLKLFFSIALLANEKLANVRSTRIIKILFFLIGRF
jgi:hypothetical protein